MKILFTLISGVLFGFGLAMSGMLNPSKVRAFLDISGEWDPSLAFVMALLFYFITNSRDDVEESNKPERIIIQKPYKKTKRKKKKDRKFIIQR